VYAGGDLTSASSDTIGIDQLTLTATGLNSGTMTKTVASAVTLGSWTGSGTNSGTQTYKLANSWSYVPGTYQTTINYTLTAPQPIDRAVRECSERSESAACTCLLRSCESVTTTVPGAARSPATAPRPRGSPDPACR
jgi:hypothetical protein